MATGKNRKTLVTRMGCRFAGVIACILVAAFGLFSTTVFAQQGGVPPPVAVGGGSYAAFPPPETEPIVHEVLNQPLSILDPGDQPIPTNKWWTHLIVSKFSGQMWAFPMMADASDQGIKIVFPVKWNDVGSDLVGDKPVTVISDDFHPVGTYATHWGDWTLTFRDKESDSRYVDVTLGRGMPFVWLECHGVSPTLKLEDNATFFSLSGNPVSLPAQADCLGIQYGGRNYGVFAPDGTRFSLVGGNLVCVFTGAEHYLIVSALPRATDFALFHAHAYALPTDSRYAWAYDPAKGAVTTSWHVDTVALKGDNHQVIQGWLPHHYRNTQTGFAFVDGLNYQTPRGLMKCGVGTDFTITYPFTGILPALPAPSKTGLPNDYDASRAAFLVQQAATKGDYGEDTYWGGKRLCLMADDMWVARELHDTASFAALRANLTKALADWYTYTPGKKGHYFASYKKWHALIGFPPSYGSQAFNDNHFHYGYFTRATALLGMADAGFLKKYGPMATLVAKQYANWDRSDTRFPFLRTFDIWEGHSWASGMSTLNGDNQESSSEAIHSWAGLFLLGEAIGNKDMTAAGAMGYAVESQAAREYWFDEYGKNFGHPNYKSPIVGILWSGGMQYTTFFSTDPAWIFGIQWFPLYPGLQYLARDPQFAGHEFDTMMSEHAAKGQGNGSGSTGMEPSLGNTLLGYAAMVRPDWSAAQMSTLWTANDPIVKASDMAAISYYDIYSDRTLGLVSWDYHVDLPCSCVYYNKRTQVASYVAYNPGTSPVVATVYKGAVAQGTFVVPAGTLVRATAMNALNTPSRK